MERYINLPIHMQACVSTFINNESLQHCCKLQLLLDPCAHMLLPCCAPLQVKLTQKSSSRSPRDQILPRDEHYWNCGCHGNPGRRALAELVSGVGLILWSHITMSLFPSLTPPAPANWRRSQKKGGGGYQTPDKSISLITILICNNCFMCMQLWVWLIYLLFAQCYTTFR